MKATKYSELKPNESRVEYFDERAERIRKRCERHAKSKIQFVDRDLKIRKGSTYDIYSFKDEKGNYHSYYENRYDRRYFEIY